ncbi:MAG: sensor histidine kinase [Clostridiales bacterium]|jgi:signal transduction histidine kinase|nr:sensor histidine kinase [Clostridiales bacterium]
MATPRIGSGLKALAVCLLIPVLAAMSLGLAGIWQLAIRYGAVTGAEYTYTAAASNQMYLDSTDIREYYHYWQAQQDGETLNYGALEAMNSAPGFCHSAEKTNLLWAIVDAGGNVLLTNLAEDNPLAAIETLTGGNVSMQTFRYRWKESSYDAYTDYLDDTEDTKSLRYLRMGLREGLPVYDSYAADRQQFEERKGYLWPIINATAIVAGVALLLFIFLVVVAGKKKGQEKIQLNFFDHVWIELVLGGWILLLCLAVEGLSYDWSAVGVLPLYLLLFLSGTVITILTLVRRVRARKLYRTSLLRQLLRPFLALGRLLRGAASHTRMMTRLLIVILGVSLFEVFCYGMRYQTFFVLVWSVGNIALVLLAIWVAIQYDTLRKATDRMAAGQLGEVVREKDTPFFKEMARNLNSAGQALTTAVEDATRSERMKTELITNVSHDIKTPLTSIINYVDLLRTTDITDEKALEYIDVLERKSRRLAQLMADLVEASKVTSGNITVELETLNLSELTKQAAGEFEARLESKNIALVIGLPEQPVYVTADGRHMWRVLDNLFGNAVKYALDGTRVYVDLIDDGPRAILMVKNVSRDPLNIRPQELMERFVRGDQARNTEGSGLGLSIARSLMELQQGGMDIAIDGDLFKVTLVLRTMPPPAPVPLEPITAEEPEPVGSDNT